jgi:hypothetical protein
MLRRSFLTAAAAAPALYSARSLAFGAGSSVAPVGSIGTSATHWCPQGYQWDGDGCVRTYWPWIGQYWPEWRGAINTVNAGLGARPWPPRSYPISGLEDPWFRAQLTPGDFADLSHLRDLLTYGAAIGGSWGLRHGGSRGATAGAIFGAEFGAALWLGYNLGVVFSRLNVGPVPPPATGGAISYNGTAYQTSGIGAYHGGVGTGGWVVIQVSGGGDPFFNVLR